MSKKTVEEYIKIRPHGVSKTGRTRVWEVFDVKHSALCGYIQWYGGFRKYCFYPTDGSLYDSDFMTMVGEFLVEVNGQHRSNLKAKSEGDRM